MRNNKLLFQIFQCLSFATTCLSPSFANSISVDASSVPHQKLAASTEQEAGTALKTIEQKDLQKVVSEAAKEMLVPGAVVILITPQGRFTANYGTTEIGTTHVPDGETHFRIASNTKTMTAALIGLLAQEKKLKLSDPVSKYVAGVPNGDKITLELLLRMRSGLYNYTDAPALSESIDKTPTRVWTPAEVLALAFKQTQKAPNSEYEYNNTNYALLGMVVEKIEGKPLRQSMQERLFAPLHMTETQLPIATSNAIPEPYSHGYLYGSSSVALVGLPSYTPAFVLGATSGKIAPTDYTSANHSFASAAGGVTSTAEDLAIWITKLTTGGVFNPEYQQQWLNSPQPEDAKNKSAMEYGNGIARLHWGPGNTFYFHGGETAGYNSFMGYDRTNHVTLVVWTNLAVSLDEKPTANSLMLKILDLLYKVSPIPPESQGS